jgi:hypothetical protein
LEFLRRRWKHGRLHMPNVEPTGVRRFHGARPRGAPG